MTKLEKVPALLQRGDWAGAERILRRAARAPNAPASVFYNLAKVLVELGKDTQALHWFGQAVTRDPAHASAWFELGRQAVAQGDLELAETGFSHAVRLEPDDLDGWRNLGRVAVRLGHWKRAIDAWSQLPAADAEAATALHRAHAETGHSSFAASTALIDRHPSAEAMAALTRTARGHLPFRVTGRQSLPDA